MTRYRVSGWPDIGKNPDIGFGKVPDDTYYFECLTRIEQLETSTYTLQDNMHRIYEIRYPGLCRRGPGSGRIA
jgi:hypothetical protein